MSSVTVLTRRAGPSSFTVKVCDRVTVTSALG